MFSAFLSRYTLHLFSATSKEFMHSARDERDDFDIDIDRMDQEFLADLSLPVKRSLSQNHASSFCLDLILLFQQQK